MSMRISRVFVNVDMRNGHVGLAALAKEYRINVAKIPAGEMVVFINSARTKMKVYCANDVLSYISRNHKISMDAVKYFPAAFNAKQKFDYDAALLMSVNECLAKGQRKALEVF